MGRGDVAGADQVDPHMGVWPHRRPVSWARCRRKPAGYLVSATLVPGGFSAKQNITLVLSVRCAA